MSAKRARVLRRLYRGAATAHWTSDMQRSLQRLWLQLRIWQVLAILATMACAVMALLEYA